MTSFSSNADLTLILLGLSQRTGDLPSFHIILSILRRFRLVCFKFGKEILHETVLFVRLDTRCSTDRRDAVLPYNKEHL